ncbi:Eukaryotic translation initiation factor 4 gamma 2 [Nymphon striatum]|nr:Eukaryotic translation initiation factor 4 gamma 2 [Nymphon striatum]
MSQTYFDEVPVEAKERYLEKLFAVSKQVAKFHPGCIYKPKDGPAERARGCFSMLRRKPVRPDVTTSSAATRRWIPPSSYKRDAITNEEKYDDIFRGVRGILNKLAPEKFPKLSDELLNIGLDSALILKGVIILIFEKALEEPKYSTLYSQLCRKLCDLSPDFSEPVRNSTPNRGNSTFRRLLLKKCQDEFENRSKATEDFDKKVGPLSPDEEEQRSIAKHKMLGNITFIGELGKQGLLPEKIIHECIKTLLAKTKRQTCKDMAEDLECLCQIMKTVGHRLDTSKAKALMDQYFSRIESYAVNQELPSRIRFMLQDVMELRLNKWIPRLIYTDNNPRTIRQIHEDAAKEYGFYIPAMHPSTNSVSSLFSDEHARLGLSRNKNGGMDDVFDSILIGTGNLGIGPGVITSDAFSDYSSNHGRVNRGGYSQNQQFGNYNRQQSNGSNGIQSSNQSQNYSNKGLPPRFKKAQLSTGRNPDEISLRPAQNSIMLKPKGQPLNNSPLYPQGNSGLANKDFSPVISQLANAQQSPLIFKAEKPKQKSSTSNITKEDALKQMESLLSNFNKKEISASSIASTLKESKIPKTFHTSLTHMVLRSAVEKGEDENHGMLLCELKKESLVSTFVDAYKQILSEMVDLEGEIPRIKSHVAGIGMRSIAAEVCSLEDICELLDNGAYYPLFLLSLQQLHKFKGKEWLVETFDRCKINLLNLMPEADKNNVRLLEVLDDRGLSFLLPLLRVQTDLKKQINVDTNPTILYNWIKESVDPSLQSSPKFVDTLVSCLIKNIVEQTTIIKDVDIPPERSSIDKEKDLLLKYKSIFQAFLHEQLTLQVTALYALHVL